MNIVKIFIKVLLKILLIMFLFSSIAYVFFVETEKYESNIIFMIKNLSQKQMVSPIGAMLSGTASEESIDARLLEVYIKSDEMFTQIDKEFNLTAYYASDQIDFFHRLYENNTTNNIIFLEYRINKHNLLQQYNNDLKIIYDEPSNTIKVAFAHANAIISQKIVKSILGYSSKVLNHFEKENTKVVLEFLEMETIKKDKLFLSSLKELLSYQSKNQVLDPKVDVASKNQILATLEAQLIQKKVLYETKAQYLNLVSVEMKLLRGNITKIAKRIQKVKREITGGTKEKELNIHISDFELLKSKVEFNKQLYIQTLTRLEETKVLLRQNTKNLIIVSDAKIDDSYTYPNKVKDSISLLIIFIFLYGIIGLIFKIIKDHKD